MRYRNQIRGKLLLSQKLRHFRGNRSHNVLDYQPLPITRYQGFMLITILSNYQWCPLPSNHFYLDVTLDTPAKDKLKSSSGIVGIMFSGHCALKHGVVVGWVTVNSRIEVPLLVPCHYFFQRDTLNHLQSLSDL